MVAGSVGGTGPGALHMSQAPSRHVSVPAPQTLVHGRVAIGTSSHCNGHAPPTQVCVPFPHAFEHGRLTGGTMQLIPQKPFSQICLPEPQALLQARVLPSAAHGSPGGNGVRAPQRTSNTIARTARTAKPARRDPWPDIRDLPSTISEAS